MPDTRQLKHMDADTKPTKILSLEKRDQKDHLFLLVTHPYDPLKVSGQFWLHFKSFWFKVQNFPFYQTRVWTSLELTHQLLLRLEGSEAHHINDRLQNFCNLIFWVKRFSENLNLHHYCASTLQRALCLAQKILRIVTIFGTKHALARPMQCYCCNPRSWTSVFISS